MDFADITLAIFVPTEDENVLKKISSEEQIDDVRVSVVTIGGNEVLNVFNRYDRN